MALGILFLCCMYWVFVVVLLMAPARDSFISAISIVGQLVCVFVITVMVAFASRDFFTGGF